MKQTAVDWLQQALEDTILTHEQIMQTIGLFEQAKEMEKQHMVDATVQYLIKHRGMHSEQSILTAVELSEQYYNETFNSKEK